MCPSRIKVSKLYILPNQSFALQYSISVRCVFVKEIDCEERYKGAHEMYWGDIRECINPPHPHRTASECERLQQQENEKHGCPISFATFLQASRLVPVIQDHWREQSCPERSNCTQAIHNRQRNKPILLYRHIAVVDSQLHSVNFTQFQFP